MIWGCVDGGGRHPCLPSARRCESNGEQVTRHTTVHLVSRGRLEACSTGKLASDHLRCEEGGLIPWVPLSRFDEEPESMLRRCRDRVEEANSPQRINLLAVCQVMTRLRYNDQDLMDIFGERDVMIESPLIQELMNEAETKGEARGEAKGVRQTLREILTF
mgnify:CR=1 FL=1